MMIYLESDRNRSLLRELQRIPHEIYKHLLDPIFIRVHSEILLHGGYKLDVFLVRLHLEKTHDFVDCFIRSECCP